MLGKMVRDEVRASTSWKDRLSRFFQNKLPLALALPLLAALRKKVDNRRYNGAALLGLCGVVIKSHGSADEHAFGHALARARDLIRSQVLQRTALSVSAMIQASMT